MGVEDSAAALHHGVKDGKSNAAFSYFTNHAKTR